MKPNDELLTLYRSWHSRLITRVSPLCLKIPHSSINSTRGATAAVSAEFAFLNEASAFLKIKPQDISKELEMLRGAHLSRMKMGDLLYKLSCDYFSRKGELIGKLEEKIGAVGGDWD